MSSSSESSSMNIIPSTADDDSSQAAISNGEPFPLKLHILLEETEKRGFTSIISWEGTNAFQVHNKELFSEMVMPSYFDSTNYKTFQRNLNLWGFRTVSKGPRKGECSHALFVRGKPDLCRSMVRVRNKTNPPDRFYQQGSAAASPGTSPTGTESTTGSHLLQSLVAAGAPPPASSGGMTGLGAALAASLNAAKPQPQQAPSNAVAAASMSSQANKQALAPALATLLQNFAASQNTGAVGGMNQKPNVMPAPMPPQQQNPFGQQQPPPQQQLQQQPLNPQMLQLLAMQNALTSSGNHMNGGTQQQQQQTPFCQPINRMATMSSISGSSDTASSQGAAPSNPAMMALASMLQQQQSPQAVKSAENTVAAAPVKREANTRVIACRARGMAMEHNIHTAFFNITPDTAHGTDLVCSYPQCRNGGVKFLYCAYCQDAIARRSFRSQHLHTGESLPSSGKPAAKRSVPTIASAGDLEEQSQKRQKVRMESAAAAEVESDSSGAAAVSQCGDNKSDVAENNSNGDKTEQPVLDLLKKSWEDLLQQRLEHKSEKDVSPWLMKVLSLADQYASQFHEGKDSEGKSSSS